MAEILLFLHHLHCISASSLSLIHGLISLSVCWSVCGETEEEKRKKEEKEEGRGWVLLHVRATGEQGEKRKKRRRRKGSVHE
jgi:hypothetical protein